MEMIPMSPTDEIRAIRRELAARFDNDLHRIFEDIQRQQRESGRVYILHAAMSDTFSKV